MEARAECMPLQHTFSGNDIMNFPADTSQVQHSTLFRDDPRQPSWLICTSLLLLRAHNMNMRGNMDQLQNIE
jgi:hypothetical protein